MWSILNLGLSYGLNSYTDQSSGYSWWQTTNGNWNCVCNGGLTMGALAILNEDPTGIAQRVLGYTVDNAAGNCMSAVSSDGTWSETSDYWYFGSTATAQMISALQTATGSDHGLLDANPNYSKTGLFHMAVTGFVEKFHYGVSYSVRMRRLSSCTIGRTADQTSTLLLPTACFSLVKLSTNPDTRSTNVIALMHQSHSQYVYL